MQDLIQADRDKTVTELVTRASKHGPVLQELRPISRSIPWLRAQRYWEQAGVEVFISGEVPYVATNDGEKSTKALALYLSGLRSAEQNKRREEMSYVLDLGAGSGLFAKLFLDQLRDRSRLEGTGDYERTTYLICDYSPGLLEDTRQTGVLAEHEDRIVRVQLTEERLITSLARVCPTALTAVRAVHANYLLDSLPFTILSSFERTWYELRVRTRLRAHVVPPEHPLPPSDDIAAFEVWLEQLGNHKPTSHHHALAYESEYVRIDRDALPHAELIPVPETMANSQQMVHSFGAIACLEQVVEVLRPDGYLLCLDYSYDGTQTEPIEFQCFGASVASGVNFAQLMAAAQRLPGVIARAPATDPASIQARLFARDQVSPELCELFASLYDKQAWEALDAPYAEGMKLVQAGQIEAARWKFAEAHRLQPYNWSLMETTVAFLTYTASDHEAGLELAKRALQLNHLSPRLWNLLGDCYYCMNALDSAERAYRHAIRILPSDVRARTNLAYVFLKRGDAADALRIIGEALSLAANGEFVDELLGKQAEALKAMAHVRTQDSVGRVNLLRGQHSLPHRLHETRSV